MFDRQQLLKSKGVVSTAPDFLELKGSRRRGLQASAFQF